MVHTCTICEKEFGSPEALEMHERAKHPDRKALNGLSRATRRRILSWGAGTAVVLLLLLAVYGIMSLSSAKRLPPSDMAGHIEEIPPKHVLKRPMGDAIQKHMLEHMDGIEGGQGGVIINYDCRTYPCEPGLIEQLEAFADVHENVYVAPYRNMRAKIVITKLNRQQRLDEYDEEAIRAFIG